jgi:tetratricopeptide (TPR) repeat protein
VRMLELGMNSQARQALQAGESRNPAATRYYIEGRGYMRRSDRVENLDLAAGAFRDALAKDPDYGLAEAGLAEAAWGKHKFLKDSALLSEAAVHAEHALQLNNRLAEVHITMGQIRIAQGDYAAAAQELEAALAIEPANASAFRALGGLYEGVRKYPEAEATYQKAIEMRPGDAAGYNDQGRFYFRSEQLPKAERSFRHSVDLTPDSPQAHSNLGVVYLQMGRYTEAIEQFQKAVSIEPNTPAYSNLGAAYYYLQRYADAVLPYQRAVEMAPSSSMYWGNLADAYRYTPALGDQAVPAYRHAIELLEKEIRANSRDPRLRARLAMYYASIGERDRALTEIAEALRLDPSQGYVQYRAALVYEQAGDRARALNSLELALKARQPMADILAAPPLEQLRKDPGFARMAGPRP